MGTVETGSDVPAEGSLPSQGDARAQGLEQEKKEPKEHCGVVENGGTQNGVGISGCGSQVLNDDGVVEVVKSSVFETKVSVLRKSDCQGLADSEMNGVSSLLQMRGSGRSADSRGARKLDSVHGSERRMTEADGLSEGGSLGVGGGEERSDGRKIEEEVEDDDHDGKIVTIDVPIVETSENMDVEVEELSDEGYGFSVGDFVWGKIKSHPWWPGRIYDPSDASDFALKLKQKNRRLLVAYFGDGTFAWCHPSQLKPFEDNFDDMVKQSSSRSFVNSVQEARNEIGKLLSMKMSHSFVANETTSGLTPLVAKNAGIKEGVLVPENGIERLSAVPMEPPELLSRVKEVAEIIAVASILEVEILKAQLSAFYLSRGGYKLPDYEDPQPVPGLEDSLMDETVHVGNGKNAVEVPVQGPFEEDYSAFLVSPKFGESGHSQGISGNRSNHRRKQKSIAEILGENKDVHTKNKEGHATDEMMNAIRSTGRKRRRDREVVMASKPVQERKELHLDSDANISSAENSGSGGKENSNKDSLPQSKEMKEAFDNENISSGSKKETAAEGKIKEQNEKGSLFRERKRSKYLSPPFTTSIRGLRKGDRETEFLQSQALPSPRVLKSNGEAFQENFPKEVSVQWELSDSSNYQTQEEDEKKTIDPKKTQAPPSEILSEFRYAAISPQISRNSTSLETLVDFISVFRSSLYRHGSLYKVYKKCQRGRKRKKPENDLEVLRKDQNQSDHLSPNHDSGPRKRRKWKETTPGEKGSPETNTGKKGTDENASAAALFVSFWPGSTLPSKADLITIYSKFGALNEAETDMFRTNYTARVCFLRTSDAEKALNHSQNINPFESSEVTFQLQYLSAGAKAGGEHGVRSKSKRSASKKKDNTLSVSVPKGSEASKLNYIKEKLQGLTSMLEASDGKSLEVKNKIVSGMKGLLEAVDKMVESSSS